VGEAQSQNRIPSENPGINIAGFDAVSVNAAAFDETSAARISGRFLADHHRKMLEQESSISLQLIDQRGYFTAQHPKELIALGFNEAQAITPALVIPLYGVDGDIVGHQSRPDKPRHKSGKPIKYETPAGWSMRLDISPAIRKTLLDPREPLWITEGAKKADSAAVRGLCCIDLIGVWNFRGANEYGGIAELADWDRIPLKSKDVGRKVYIVYDNDILTKPGVRAAMIRLARILRRKGARPVHAVVIPARMTGKTGLDDYFRAGGNVNELRESTQDDLLENTAITINNRSLAEITTDSLKALVAANHPPQIFVRAGNLVRVVEDERMVAKIRDLDEHSLRGMFARCASFVRKTKSEDTEMAPPKDMVMDVISLGRWPEIPPIVSIIKAPVLAHDGTLSLEPGYCPKSKVYIASKESWPEYPGSAQEAARFILDDVLGDFPFSGEADRANTLALMVLPIVRGVIEGPTPLHLFDAPAPGTGKSKLATISLMPTMGDEITATTGTKDEEEWRKKIASALLEGRAYVFLDNLSRKVDSETLAGVLTSREWNDRALGSLSNINVPVRSIWIATSNNADLSREILRRTVWIRLDAHVERPEDRTDFKHPQIEQWVSANRAVIVSALCRLVSEWVGQGRPFYTGRKLGSYEEWSKVIGGILQVADVPGFLGNIEALRDSADSEEPSWAAFYERWYEHFEEMNVKTGELREIFEEDDALRGLLGGKDEFSRATRLGHLIKKRVDMIAGGYKVERTGQHRRAGTYRLVKFAREGDEKSPITSKETPQPRAQSQMIEEAEL